jgi:hypothetical protein
MQQFPFIDLFKSALHVSGDVFAHPQEQFNCIYIALVQCTDLMPTGATVEMQVPSQPCHRSVHCTKAVYTVKLLLKMGENAARNI